MEQLPVNPACALSGTKYCRLLNMRDCEKCAVGESNDLDAIRKDIDVYETLLPEGGVSRLFTSRECQFCKGEKKGEKAGYAILDMAHPEPKRIQKFLLGKRRLEIGTMISLQMGVCKNCRRRFLWMDYLPTVVPALLGAAGLALMAAGPLAEALGDWNPIAPVAVWLLIVGAGCGLGKLLSRAVRRRGESEMRTDVLTHPVVREMLERGWNPITRRSTSRLLFSKSRLARGLGTAIDGPKAPKLPEYEEND